MRASPSSLSSKQRAELRKRAHHLRPALHIGKGGITPATLHAVEEAFSSEELLKIKVLETAPEPARETAQSIVGQLEDATVVQVMGRIATLYRPLPDKQ